MGNNRFSLRVNIFMENGLVGLAMILYILYKIGVLVLSLYLAVESARSSFCYCSLLSY